MLCRRRAQCILMRHGSMVCDNALRKQTHRARFPMCTFRPQQVDMPYDRSVVAWSETLSECSGQLRGRVQQRRPLVNRLSHVIEFGLVPQLHISRTYRCDLAS